MEVKIIIRQDISMLDPEIIKIIDINIDSGEYVYRIHPNYCDVKDNCSFRG